VGLFAAVYSIGAESQVEEEEAQAFLEEFEEIIEDIDGFGIFTHNLVIAIPMFIPGFGVGWGFFSAWQTGYAFAALVSTTPLLSEIPPLTLLFVSPFGLMEITAYAMAMSRSLLLVSKLIKRISIKQDAKVVGIEIGIVIGLLVAGGFLEAYMIELVQEAGFDMPGF